MLSVSLDYTKPRTPIDTAYTSQHTSLMQIDLVIGTVSGDERHGISNFLLPRTPGALTSCLVSSTT